MVRRGLCLLVVLATACGGSEPATDPVGSTRGDTSTTHRLTTTVTTVPLNTSAELSPGNDSDEGEDTAGMSPHLRDSIADQVLAAAADHAGVDPGDVEIVSTTKTVFNDGSLGCPEKGYSYVQVLTPGWVVDVKAGESRLEYHVSEGGDFVLCP